MRRSKTQRPIIRRLATILLAAAATLALAGLAATSALASEGGMPGMTEAEMQAQGHTQEEPVAEGASGHGDEASGHGAGEAAPQNAGGTQHGSMGGAVNWLVIGAFVLIVVGSTLAALATKRRLRRRMATGELATAGVQHV